VIGSDREDYGGDSGNSGNNGGRRCGELVMVLPRLWVVSGGWKGGEGGAGETTEDRDEAEEDGVRDGDRSLKMT
jgi:hypothetical protein